jgi:6-pyruvoyltetrahydropterin/6-carboxytetrahydropterin synthase
MFKLKIVRKFDAAHFVKGYDGKCANLHGHTWKVVFIFTYFTLDKIGIAQDFKELKSVVDKILPDHKSLNDTYLFNPTAENLAKYFYELIKEKTGNLTSVEVWETEDSCAEYSENF